MLVSLLLEESKTRKKKIVFVFLVWSRVCPYAAMILLLLCSLFFLFFTVQNLVS
jgi:hypothetical protein